ncbi:hypothetical protein Tco_0032045 [Tanacetum coccineum]
MHVILFGTIPTTIPDTTPSVIPPSTHIDTALTPTSPDYTPASPDYSPVSDTEFDPSEDPLLDHILPLPAISLFLTSTDDSSDTSGALHHRVMILAPGQPIPHVEYFSLYHFALDDSLRDSSSSSSSETSLDPSSDDLSDSSSDHSLPALSSGMRPSHHLCLLVPSTPHSSAVISDRPPYDSSSASPSRKRSRSPTASVQLYLHIPGALSFALTDILPSPKRIRSPELAMDLEVSSEKGFEPSRYRGTDLDNDERSDWIYIDPKIQAEINECIAYADALRVRGIDARVVVKAVDREEIETGGGSYKGHAIKSVQRAKGRRIVVTGQQSVDMMERIRELERDNRKLRDMMDVTRLLGLRLVSRGIWATILRLFCKYPSVDPTMPNTRSGASRTHEGINKNFDRRLAGALGAYNATRNLEPL